MQINLLRSVIVVAVIQDTGCYTFSASEILSLQCSVQDLIIIYNSVG